MDAEYRGEMKLDTSKARVRRIMCIVDDLKDLREDGSIAGEHINNTIKDLLVLANKINNK